MGNYALRVQHSPTSFLSFPFLSDDSPPITPWPEPPTPVLDFILLSLSLQCGASSFSLIQPTTFTEHLLLKRHSSYTREKQPMSLALHELSVAIIMAILTVTDS